MIIFIDASGNENVIRNDKIAIDLFKRGSIKEDTLVKTSIRGEWKKAKEIDIFQNLLEVKNNENKIDQQQLEKESIKTKNIIDKEEDIIKEEENIKEDIITPETVTASEIVEENIEVNTDNNDNDVLEIDNHTQELKKSVPSSKTNEADTNKSNITSYKINLYSFCI